MHCIVLSRKPPLPTPNNGKYVNLVVLSHTCLLRSRFHCLAWYFPTKHRQDWDLKDTGQFFNGGARALRTFEIAYASLVSSAPSKSA